MASCHRKPKFQMLSEKKQRKSHFTAAAHELERKCGSCDLHQQQRDSEMSVAPGPAMLAVALPDILHEEKCPSPVSEFIPDEEAASICPLLTPSPSSVFHHPLSVMDHQLGGLPYEQPVLPQSTDGMEIPTLAALSGNAALGYVGLSAVCTDLSRPSAEGETHLFGADSCVQSVVESSSSSSSALHESTACAQLLGSHHYQHLTKAANSDTFPCQEAAGKPPLAGIPLAVRKSPGDYCFMGWNWPLIRKVSFWGVASLLVACTCVVIAVVANLPAECSPAHRWWQGNLFYEIFPGSFQDSNADTIGDLQGIRSRVQYLESLGVRAVRLNSIFPAAHYPEGYDAPTTLTGIERVLGTQQDFELLVQTLHQRNVSLVLDLPLHPYFRSLAPDDDNSSQYSSASVSGTLEHWLERGVDGFFLQGLEKYVDEPALPSLLERWRRTVDAAGPDRIIMCSAAVVDALAGRGDAAGLRAVRATVDLLDVVLDVSAGNGTARGVKRRVDEAVRGLARAGVERAPWLHWRIGGEGVLRLASRLPTPNASLGATLLFSLLPGTLSVFYGDEIGLMDSSDPEGDRQDIEHLRHLAPMHWTDSAPDVGFTGRGILPWLPGSASWSHIGAGRQSALRDVARLRAATPCIFMDAVRKERTSVPNYEMRSVGSDMLVLERWYPRRHSYVAIANLGSAEHVLDLSSHYYGGRVVADLRGRAGQYLTFQSLRLAPGEAVVVELDK